MKNEEEEHTDDSDHSQHHGDSYSPGDSDGDGVSIGNGGGGDGLSGIDEKFLVVSQKAVALHISQFLDPKSFHSWCSVWMMENVDGNDNRNDDVLATLNRLGRLGEALPSYFAYSKPLEMITTDHDVWAMSSTLDGNDGIWERKRRLCTNNASYFDSYSYERMQTWLGVTVPSEYVNCLNMFLRGFLDHAALRAWHKYQPSIIFREDLARCVDAWNIRYSFPLDKTLNLPVFSGIEFAGTLRDISNWSGGEETPIRFSLRNLSHDEQVSYTKGLLQTYLKKASEDHNYQRAYERWRLNNHVGQVACNDPLSNLGQGNMSDTDWDEWICNADDSQRISEAEIVAEYKTLAEDVTERLHSLIRSLPSLRPEEDSITNPNFRLSRVGFLGIVDEILSGYSPRLVLTHSASDFLQRIVEDVVFGDVMRSFQVQAPTLGVEVCCIVLLGNVHGTTMTRFEVSTQEDNNYDGTSDSEYDPLVSDTEESDVGDDGEESSDGFTARLGHDITSEPGSAAPTDDGEGYGCTNHSKADTQNEMDKEMTPTKAAALVEASAVPLPPTLDTGLLSMAQQQKRKRDHCESEAQELSTSDQRKPKRSSGAAAQASSQAP